MVNFNSIEKLDRLFCPNALAVVKLDRINDRYVRSLFPREDCKYLDDLKISSLITSGSNWSQALGWRSLFGIPFKHAEKTFLAIGAETFKPHPTRGAYLISKSFIFPYPPTENLITSLQELQKSFVVRSEVEVEGKKLDGWLRRFNRNLRAKSENPADHTSVERWIIGEAIQAYENQLLLYWRTLAFTDQHFNLPLAAKKKLIVTVPHLESMLSAKKLKGNLLQKIDGCARKTNFTLYC